MKPDFSRDQQPALWAVAEALRQECLDIFGSTWNNDNSLRLAKAAIDTFVSLEPIDAKSAGRPSPWEICVRIVENECYLDQRPVGPVAEQVFSIGAAIRSRIKAEGSGR